MAIWHILIAFSVASLAAVFFSVMFVAFADEWRKQRQAHLALFAIASAFAASALFAFLTAIFQAGMKGQAPENALTIPSSLFLSVSLVTASVGSVAAFFRRRLVSMLLLIAFLPFAGRFWINTLRGQEWPAEALGMNLAGLGLLAFSLSATVAMVSFRRKRSVGAGAHADRYLMVGGWCGVLASLASFSWFSYDFLPAVYGAVFFAGASAWYLCFGAIAKWHNDARVMAKPTFYWRRHLAAKNAVVGYVLIWGALTLLVSFVIVSEYRLRTTEAMRDLRFDISQAAASYRQAEDTLLTNLNFYAQQPSVRGVLDAAAKGEPINVSLGLHRSVAQLFRIFDAAGRVVWSSDGVEDIGRSNADSPVALRAGAGFRISSIEHELSWDNRPAMKAGIPVAASDGTIGALVASVELHLTWPAEPHPGVSRAIITNGSVLDQSDAFDWSRVRSWLKSSPMLLTEPWQLSDSTWVVAWPLSSTDGETVGWAVASFDGAGLYAATLHLALPALALVLMLSLLLALIIGWQSNRLAKQIEQIASSLARLAIGQPVDIAETSTADEMADLITADREAISAIKKQSQDFEQSLRSERDFLTNVVREMRAPLNGLRWALDLLRFGDTGRLKRNQLEVVEHMYQSSGRLTRLVRNLADVSALESGNLKLMPEEMPLEDSLRSAAGVLAVPIREKNLRLEWPKKIEGDLVVRADRQRLHEIILNLLSNAVKYTPAKGRIRIGLSVVERVGVDDKSVKFAQVSIEDNGQGIPRADQSRIFERFYRSDRSINEEVEGAGLGLHLVKLLVENHGGAIWFESVENAGTTFYFTIPLASK